MTVCCGCDGVEVIGVALTAKAQGSGHRLVALLVGVPVSTVRGWLRRFAVNAAMVRVWFTVLAHDLDPLLGVDAFDFAADEGGVDFEHVGVEADGRGLGDGALLGP